MTPQADLDLAFTLRQSCDTLRDSLHGISEEDARKCPAPGRWSALDCVEHLVIAEEAALKRLQSAQPLSEPVYQPEREVALAAVANRGDRVEAPLRALPTGRFASLEEALAHFSAARQRTIAFIETEPPLRSLQVTHPFFGPISGYEYTLLVAAHPVRHAVQIREIREQLKDNG
jgi:hypothetical protein